MFYAIILGLHMAEAMFPSKCRTVTIAAHWIIHSTVFSRTSIYIDNGAREKR